MKSLEKNFNLIVILGPTASGKTGLASKLAYRFNGEIISADSRQVYKGMNIGTGKDFEDYIVDNFSIPYHLIDIVTPYEEYNLFSFVSDFKKSFDDITKRNKLSFLAGGTGLYLNAILKKYELKEAEFDENEFQNLQAKSFDDLLNIYNELNVSPHNITDKTDQERLIRAIIVLKSNNKTAVDLANVNPFVLGVKLNREETKKRITARLKKRLKEGMVEEVNALIKNGVSFEKLDFFGLEYRYIALYLNGKLNYNDMFQKLNSAIHTFAKKQLTWFRKMERDGIVINWIEGADYEAAEKLISQNFIR